MLSFLGKHDSPTFFKHSILSIHLVVLFQYSVLAYLSAFAPTIALILPRLMELTPLLVVSTL
jgi:hypothetical protein